MDEDGLKRRTKEFALRILRLSAALPDTPEGRAVRYQIVKSGTSVGANYRAACKGRSKAEFVAKLGIVEEEADETAFWLEVIIEGGLLSEAKARPLWQEACELTAIMATSKLTARRRDAAPNRKSQVANRKSRKDADERRQ